MQAIRSKRLLVVFNACFSGNISPTWQFLEKR
jgi:hypothetical protein